MFDLVLCNHDLFGEHKGEKHQTKDLDECCGGFFDEYEVTPSGRLEFLDYVIEDRSDPNSTGIKKFGGGMARILTGKRFDMNYDGWLHLSAFGRADFVDGTIVAFEPEPYDFAYEETVTPAIQVAMRIVRKRIAALRKLAERQAVPQSEHMKVRDLAEQLKQLDPDSEVSVFVRDMQVTDPCTIFIVDEHGRGIEVHLTVEPADAGDRVGSGSESVKDESEIRDARRTMTESIEVGNRAEERHQCSERRRQSDDASNQSDGR